MSALKECLYLSPLIYRPFCGLFPSFPSVRLWSDLKRFDPFEFVLFRFVATSSSPSFALPFSFSPYLPLYPFLTDIVASVTRRSSYRRNKMTSLIKRRHTCMWPYANTTVSPHHCLPLRLFEYIYSTSYSVILYYHYIHRKYCFNSYCCRSSHFQTFNSSNSHFTPTFDFLTISITVDWEINRDKPNITCVWYINL